MPNFDVTHLLDFRRVGYADFAEIPIFENVTVLLPRRAKNDTFWVSQATRTYLDDPPLQHKDPFALSTIGVDEDQRAAMRKELAYGESDVDPVARYLIAHTNGIAYSHLAGKINEYVIPELRLPPGDGKIFLDIGCSWGRWSIAAARAGYHVVGIDPSLGAVMAATRIAQQLGVEASFLCADARLMPFRDECIDVAYSYSVLQHFSKPNAALAIQEIRRVLKVGGRSMIQMPNAQGARSRYHLARRKGEAKGFDVRYWKPRELERIFDKVIGPTTLSVDCFFGLGLQASDRPYMKPMARTATSVSEVLRAMSKPMPGLHKYADSLFVESTKRPI